MKGGAIYAENALLEIKNCTFENNNAEVGGAIFIVSNSKIILISKINK